MELVVVARLAASKSQGSFSLCFPSVESRVHCGLPHLAFYVDAWGMTQVLVLHDKHITEPSPPSPLSFVWKKIPSVSMYHDSLQAALYFFLQCLSSAYPTARHSLSIVPHSCLHWRTMSDTPCLPDAHTASEDVPSVCFYLQKEIIIEHTHCLCLLFT